MDWLRNAKLIAMVEEYALKYGDFKLSSGKQSHYFVDMSKVTNRSDCLDIITQSILYHLEHADYSVQSVGGPVLGAAPLVGGFVMAYQRQHYGVGLMRGFLIRKEEKDGEIIEGNFSPGDNVVIFEDVVTTGRQVKRAVDIVESKGGVVKAIIAVLDRLAGAKDLLGDRFHSMMTIDDLGVVKCSTDKPSV